MKDGSLLTISSISLGPNGLYVLDKYANVYPQIKSKGFSYIRLGAYFEDGEKFAEIKAGQEDVEGGYPAVRIMRTVLQDLLLDACEDEKSVDMQWGKRLSEVRQNEHGVQVVFEDGTSAKGQLDPCIELNLPIGDILIGADGVHSQIRNHILGPSSPPAQFADVFITNGFLPRSSAILPNPSFKFPAFTFTPSGMFMTVPIDPEAETLAWGINMPTLPRSREEWKKAEEDGSASRTAKTKFDSIYRQPVRSLLDNARDEYSKIYVPYHVPRVDRWYKGRLCLLGDAAHAMPEKGQGSGLAFEDIAILTRYLTRPSSLDTTADWEGLFIQFQKSREPRIDKVRASSKSFTSARESKGWMWVWWCKKWAFRGFSWWKGGVLDFTSQTVYNVDQVDLSD
jgi:2-polyprenyl-6-methoxyphenol hydroxylase-like FAD-dependent oxidoreductase